MKTDRVRRSVLIASSLLATGALVLPSMAQAQALKPGKLRVAILADIANFDPAQFSSVNFPLIKNLYDSLIEYTAEGQAIPSLASAWSIAPGNTAVTLTLRRDVTFHSGAPFNADAVAATLKKSADPKTGKNVYPTMSVVKDWTVVDPYTVRLNFNSAVPDKQITDLLQFISPIEPAGIETAETKPAGTGAYMLAERVLGQRMRMVVNPKYWRPEKPLISEVTLTVFSDNDAASAALESGAVDIIYGGDSRSAARLRSAGNQLIQGPGPLVQVFRINTTQGPFKNEKFRQAFNFLMDRQAILQVGYAGLGEVTALPWAPASPAVDKSYDTTYAFNLDKGKAMLKESGLSEAEMNNWKMLVNGGDQAVAGDQPGGAEHAGQGRHQGRTRPQAGIGVHRRAAGRQVRGHLRRHRQHPEIPDPGGDQQHLPHVEEPGPGRPASVSRVCGGDRACQQDRSAPTSRRPTTTLNKVLVESAFAIPTNTYDIGLIVAPKVGGITREIDNMLVVRTVGLR